MSVLFYPTEGLYFFQMVHQDRGLMSRVVSVELGDVIDLHVILDSISETIQSALKSPVIHVKVSGLHAVTSRSVSIVLAAL